MLLQHQTSAKYWQQQHAGGVNNSIVLSGLTREDSHRRISPHPSLKEARLTHSLRRSPATIVLDIIPLPSAIGLDSHMHSHTYTHTRDSGFHTTSAQHRAIERMSFLHYVYETSNITV